MSWFRTLTLTTLLCATGAALGQQSLKSAAMRKADQLFRDQNWEEAAKAYRDILDRDPNNYQAWFNLGYTHHARGDYDKAIEAGLKAIEFQQISMAAQYNLACAYSLKGSLDEAAEHLGKALEAGFLDYKSLMKDSDLKNLRDDPRFDKLMHKDRRQELKVPGAGTITYALQLPEDYDPEKAYPALLAMSPGEGGFNSLAYGMNAFWGKQAAKRGWIVLAPIIPFGGWMTKQGSKFIAALLDHVAEEYKIEGGKFHIAGLLNGGFDAVHFAVEMPERFHTLTGMPALPAKPDRGKLDELKGLRVHILVDPQNKQFAQGAKQFKKVLSDRGVDASLTVLGGDGKPGIADVLNGGLMEILDKQRVK